MYQGTKIALQNALFLGFFQSAKPSNLRALLNRSKNALLGDIFPSLCFNCDTKSTHKRSFSSTEPSFSVSDVNMPKILAKFIAAAARKPQSYYLLDFSKSKTLW